MSEAASDAGHSTDRGPPAEEAIGDLNADTAETDECEIVDGPTAETVPLIVFKYNQNTEKALTDHFPREKITKPIDGEIVFERSNTADVLLNKRVFGRKHAVLFCRQSQNGCVAVMLQNKHEKKKLFVIRGKDKRAVGPGGETELFSNDEIHLEVLVFIVEIHEGDCEAKTFEFQLKSYVEHTFPGSSVKQNAHPVPGNTQSIPCIVYQQQMVFPEISSQNMSQTTPLMSPLNTNVSGPFPNLQNVTPPIAVVGNPVMPGQIINGNGALQATSYAAVQLSPYALGQPITYAPVQPTTYAHVQSNALNPAQSTPYVPGQSTAYTPRQSASFVPVQSTAYTPRQSASFVPVQSTAYTPRQSASFVPVQSTAYTPRQSASFVPVQSTAYTYNQRQVEPIPRAACPSSRHSSIGSIMSQPTTDDTAPGFLPSPPQGSVFPQRIGVMPYAVVSDIPNTEMPNIPHVSSVVYQPVTNNFVTMHAMEESSQSHGQNNQAEGQNSQGQIIEGQCQAIGGQDQNQGQSQPGMEFHFGERRGGTVPEICSPNYYANMNSVSLGGENRDEQ